MSRLKRVKKTAAAWSPPIRSFFFLIALAVLGQGFLSQSEKPFTLWLGLLFYGAALWKLRRVPFSAVGKDSFPLSFKTETVLLILILVLAFALRIFRIEEIPAGMHTDQGLTGLSALRILYEGWHPFPEALNYQVPEPLLFYQLAGWFGLVGSSYFTFHLFFVLLSLAAFPLIYWVFRQLAGPKIALLALFILSVMRWNWIETRNGYPSVQVSLYLFGALALWLYGLKVRKQWPFFLSALFIGAGLYTYQAFKAVPFLILTYVIYEYVTRWNGTKMKRPRLLLCAILVLAVASPLIHYDLQNKTFGNREGDLFIGHKIAETGSLKPAWDVWSGTALMFNREGDMNPRHNIPGHRMLDDVTGILWVLGLALAWRLRKKREGYYPLAGFFVMSLPGLLSTDIAHSNRLVCLTPFVAYFAALGGMAIYKRAKTLWPEEPRLAARFGVVLAGIAALNSYTYFVTQANDKNCKSAFGLAQYFVGFNLESFQKYSKEYYFYADSSLFHNHTVSFLDYPARKNTFEFNLQDWAQGNIPKDKTPLLFMEPNKTGVVDFLKTAYPGMKSSSSQDSNGRILFYTCASPPSKLVEAKPWDKGLKGVYFNSNQWNSPPLAVRWDPVLNMTNQFDFPFTQPPPFKIRWSGALEIANAGAYQFQFLASDQAKLWLDGRPAALEKPLALSAGSHPLRINFEKNGGDEMALTFIWKKPGADKWEVVPGSVFGKKAP